MSLIGRRDATVLAAAGALALLVPLVASHYLHLRIRSGLEPALERRLGVDVEVGGIDASFTGVVRISGIRVGDVFSADSVEAAIGIGPLVSGHMYLDEVRVNRPRLRVVGSDGTTNVERILERLRATASSHGRHNEPHRSRIGRAVVSDGELVVDLANRGRIRARDVELVSRPGGTRLITGPVVIEGHYRGARVDARFQRSAADLALLAQRARRLLAVGGEVRIDTPTGHTVRLHGAALSRGIRAVDGAVMLRGAVRHPGGVSQVDVAAVMRPQLRLRVSGHALPLAVLTGASRPGLDLSHAFVDGAVELGATGDGALRLTSSASLRGLRIDNAHVASVPVVVDGRVDVDASVRRTASGLSLNLRRLRLARSGAALIVRGTIDWRGSRLPVRADVTAELPTVACQNALTALPVAMRDRLTGLVARGSMHGAVSLRFDRERDQTALNVDVDPSRCHVVREAYHADPRRLKRRDYRHILPTGERRRLGRGAAGYVRLRSLPRHVADAFISGEDARFFHHHGFDPKQIQRSLAIDLHNAQFRRGGSTISQQLVKNLFLTHRRTLARKFQEAVLAWRLEKHLSKRAILERYLNVIELGQGVFGIAAAAHHWFDKPARRLTLNEAAFLAALTPAPTTISKRIRAAGRLDAATHARVLAILRAMRRNRAISRAQYRRARDTRLDLHVAKLARN